MSNSVKIKNRRASFEYFLVDRIVAGIQLTGTEIKSIRDGKANLADAYCNFTDPYADAVSGSDNPEDSIPDYYLFNGQPFDLNTNPGRTGEVVLDGFTNVISKTQLGVNGAYDIDIEDLGNHKYRATTKFYIMRDKETGKYQMIRWPADHELIKEMNEHGLNIRNFPKYTDANNLLIHPVCTGMDQVILYGKK